MKAKDIFNTLGGSKDIFRAKAPSPLDKSKKRKKKMGVKATHYARPFAEEGHCCVMSSFHLVKY